MSLCFPVSDWCAFSTISCKKPYFYHSTVIQVHIPDELDPTLQQVPGEVEAFIVEAMQKQLASPMQAEDANIETSSAIDAGDEFLSPDEVQYYLNLPDVRPRL